MENEIYNKHKKAICIWVKNSEGVYETSCYQDIYEEDNDQHIVKPFCFSCGGFVIPLTTLPYPLNKCTYIKKIKETEEEITRNEEYIYTSQCGNIYEYLFEDEDGLKGHEDGGVFEYCAECGGKIEIENE